VLAKRLPEVSQTLAQLPKQHYSKAHCSSDENGCPASVSQQIMHLFRRGIPEVNRFRDRARQIPSKPQENEEFNRSSFHEGFSLALASPLAQINHIIRGVAFTTNRPSKTNQRIGLLANQVNEMPKHNVLQLGHPA